MTTHKTRMYRSRGIAAIEFALVLPFLMLIALAVVDFCRVIQAQLIITNVSREGANLSARSSLDLADNAQTVMNALAATTPPLTMSTSGMIYITKVMGFQPAGSAVRNVVLEQYRWANGWASSSYAPASEVWNCGAAASSWAGNGSCQNIPTGNGAPAAAVMPGDLAAGDLIYVVEVFYKFPTMFGGTEVGGGLKVPEIGPTLSSMTVL